MRNFVLLALRARAIFPMNYPRQIRTIALIVLVMIAFVKAKLRIEFFPLKPAKKFLPERIINMIAEIVTCKGSFVE